LSYLSACLDRIMGQAQNETARVCLGEKYRRLSGSNLCALYEWTLYIHSPCHCPCTDYI
jgi:hypothetical protein